MLPGVLSLACTAGLFRQSARTETAAADALRLFMSEILSLASGLAMVEVTLDRKIAARKRAERQVRIAKHVDATGEARLEATGWRSAKFAYVFGNT
jgi:hypothetical protein